MRNEKEQVYDRLIKKAYPAIQKNVSPDEIKKKMNKFKKNFTNNLNRDLLMKRDSPEFRKSHFKAAYTIYLNYNSCLQDKAAKELRKEEDLKEAAFNPRLTQRMSHANLRFKSLDPKEGPPNYTAGNKILRKSYNEPIERSYDDFEMQTEDSVVEINKQDQGANMHRQSCDTWNQTRGVKSLSPDMRSSIYFGNPSASLAGAPLDMFKTRENFLARKENLDSAKENFRSLRNKAKSGLEKSNFLRRKHYKGDTLYKGEGKLFMTKGLSNSIYDATMVKSPVYSMQC